MVEALFSLGATGMLRAITSLLDSEAEELDAGLGGVFSFLSMKATTCAGIDARWTFRSRFRLGLVFTHDPTSCTAF